MLYQLFILKMGKWEPTPYYKALAAWQDYAHLLGPRTKLVPSNPPDDTPPEPKWYAKLKADTIAQFEVVEDTREPKEARSKFRFVKPIPRGEGRRKCYGLT